MDQEPNLTLVNSLKDDEEIEYIKNVLEKDFNLFETKEEGKKREEILVSLKECVKQAVKNIYKSKGKTDEEANTAGGGVFTFGSYRLGIAGPGDDIDVLCIAPAIDTNDNNKKCNSRIELIEAIAKQLKLLKNKKEITQILLVSDAKVPIIKLIFKDIPVDILVASVSFKTIDETFNLEDDNVLKNCCEKCILSLNGCRVTNAIFKCLPKGMKIDDFKLTLRVIKLWAKKRGIYSNAIGYPGGVAWAILVAKVCQLYPKCRANVLIRKFFEIYSNWDWKNPVQINEIKEDIGFTCPVPVWKKEIEEQEIKNHSPFYIITPAFPAQNTNPKTNPILKRVMVEEFNMFKEYSEKINIEDKNNIYTWKDLFKNSNIVDGYKYFLQIDILSIQKSDLKEWDGYVESRFKQKLIKYLSELTQIKVRPFSIIFGNKDPLYLYSKTYIFGINFVDPETLESKPNKIINLREPVKKFVSELDNKYRKIKKKNEENSINVRINFKASKDLPIEILQMK